MPSVALGTPAFRRTVEVNTRAPILPGNAITLLRNGDEFFPAMLTAIRSAQRTIDLVQYVFEKPGMAARFADALADRCRAGVSANVLLDAIGSFNIPDAYVTSMRAAGCRVTFFRPLRPWAMHLLNHRLHRRILVVDGRVGFTGGFGISEKWTGNGATDGHWRDTSVRVEGPIVQQLQAAFAENWREATKSVIGGLDYLPAPSVAGTMAAQAVSSSPIGGSFDAYMLFLLAIDGARHSIDITNPYFVPDARMREAVLAAVHRGVKVRVLLPGKIDHVIVREASHKRLGRLLRAGVEVYQYEAALLHSKTMVVDGVWATIGSTNFDNRSFALNEELNLTVYDVAFAARVEQMFEDDLRRSTRITYEQWTHRGVGERVLELLAWPIRSEL